MSDNKNLDIAVKIAKAVSNIGGCVYFVGGYVRDKIRGFDNKDIDIEVHGISPKQLENILDGIGKRISIGESFGIYNLIDYSIDIAMPRKEINRGTGHRNFDILVDPHIGTYKAAKRRDFTVNALMQNVLTDEIIDHFNGINDLKNKVIRHINADTFVEDPLRVLRAAQFAARFDFSVAPETVEICKNMDLSELASERIVEELKKALLKSDKPSIFFETLRNMNQLSFWFPELQALIGVEQSKIHHAEGDVWTHTMMVIDAAAKYRDVVDNPFGFMLSALTHDFGKAICTENINGIIHAYSHEAEGLPLIEAFVTRLTNNKQLIKYVLNLSEHHMKPNKYAAAKSSIKATNKMFFESVEPRALLYLAKADELGRISESGTQNNDDFFESRLKKFYEYMERPYVTGRDLINAGLVPDKEFSNYLKLATKLRLAGVNKEKALLQIMGEIKYKN